MTDAVCITFKNYIFSIHLQHHVKIKISRFCFLVNVHDSYRYKGTAPGVLLELFPKRFILKLTIKAHCNWTVTFINYFWVNFFVFMVMHVHIVNELKLYNNFWNVLTNGTSIVKRSNHFRAIFIYSYLILVLGCCNVFSSIDLARIYFRISGVCFVPFLLNCGRA